MVRMTSELETNIVSVERTKEYSETPTEVRTCLPPSLSTLEEATIVDSGGRFGFNFISTLVQYIQFQFIDLFFFFPLLFFFSPPLLSLLSLP